MSPNAYSFFVVMKIFWDKKAIKDVQHCAYTNNH